MSEQLPVGNRIICHKKGWIALKKILSFFLTAWMILSMACPAFAEERTVLTIGDVSDRSNSRMDGENQLGMWQYLEDRLNVEIDFVYLSAEEYSMGLSSG